MRPSQILAIEQVRMESSPQARERLVEFYHDLVGLEWDERSSDEEQLCFRSAQLELVVLMRANPVCEAVHRKAVISVRCIETLAGELMDKGMEFLRVSGLSGTDRRLSLLDPAGNRVELKQEWRYGVFPDLPGPKERPTER